MNFNFHGFFFLAFVFIAGMGSWTVYIAKNGIRSWKDFIWPVVITCVTLAVLLTQ